jgi:hypothetical protein
VALRQNGNGLLQGHIGTVRYILLPTNELPIKVFCPQKVKKEKYVKK